MSEYDRAKIMFRACQVKRKKLKMLALNQGRSIQDILEELTDAFIVLSEAAENKKPATVRSVKPKGSTRGGAGLVGNKIHRARPTRQRAEQAQTEVARGVLRARSQEVSVAPPSWGSPHPCWPGSGSVEKIGTHWFVLGEDASSVGPFDSHAKAWKWLDRQANEVTSPAEKRADYRWSGRS